MPGFDIESFSSLISRFRSDWSSIDLRIVAQRTRDGEWVCNAMRAVLGSQVPSAGRRFELPSNELILSIQHPLEATRLDELLHSLLDGKLEIDDKIIHVGYKEGSEWRPAQSIFYRFYDRRQSFAKFGVNSATYSLTLWQTIAGILGDMPDTIDASLRSASPPWDGLADLRQEFVGLPKDESLRTDAGTAEIVYPIGVHFSEVPKLEKNVIDVSFEATKMTDFHQLGVSVIANLGSGSLYRKRHSVERAENGILGSYKMKVSLPGEVSWAKLFLVYKGVDADRQDLYGKAVSETNPKRAASESLGYDPNSLHSLLTRPKSNEMTKAVAILLFELGFQAVPYGFGDRDVPDIVAFPTSGKWFLVIECTEREIDANGKLAKLVARTQKLRTVIPEFDSYPIVITSLGRTVLARSDLEKAGKEGIAVVSSDEIPQLLHMVVDDADSDQVLEYLLRLIPVSDLFSR